MAKVVTLKPGDFALGENDTAGLIVGRFDRIEKSRPFAVLVLPTLTRFYVRPDSLYPCPGLEFYEERPAALPAMLLPGAVIRISDSSWIEEPVTLWLKAWNVTTGEGTYVNHQTLKSYDSSAIIWQTIPIIESVTTAATSSFTRAPVKEGGGGAELRAKQQKKLDDARRSLTEPYRGPRR
jgi:hypothetical protein